MSFQYCSDLHLELYNDMTDKDLEDLFNKWIDPKAPFLVLAGDIGNPFEDKYKKLLEWCSSRFTTIFVVSGNHEYYMKGLYMNEMNFVDKRLKDVCSSFRNIHYLQRNTVEVDLNGIHYYVLGCTFWSPIPEELQGYMASRMNDYKKILTPYRTIFTPRDSNKLHLDHKRWIFAELEYLKDKLDNNSRIVVITHHAPVSFLDSMKRTPCGYTSDYEDLIESYVYAWISGHTHQIHDKKTGKGTIMVANCIGYQDEDTGYKRDAIF